MIADVEGLALVDAYLTAMRTRVEFTPAPSPLVEVYLDPRGWQVVTRTFEPTVELMLAELHLLRCAEETAHDDLWVHILTNGPVETATGIWRLDGDERLTYRRHGHPVISYGREPCTN